MVLDTIARGRVDLLIADPSDDSGRRLELMLSLRERFPSILVVAYTRLTPAVVPQVIRLAQANVREIVLYGHDDTSARFAGLVEQANAHPLTSRVIGLLEARLGDGQPALRVALRELFRSPLRFRAVPDLAAVAGMSRRTLYRQLQLAGLHSPRLVVATGRVIRAVSMLGDPGRSLAHVAAALGYSRPEHLAEQIFAVTGMATRETREEHDFACLARTIIDHIGNAPPDTDD